MTPGYSPPEQYGTAHTDSRTDIYSLGATLYSALTDALPEDGLARAMDQADLTQIRKHNPKVTRRLAAVIERALEVKPDNRYQNAEEFREDLVNSKNSTRQRVDLNITPPPAISETGVANRGGIGGEKTPAGEAERSSFSSNGTSLVALPTNAPLVDGTYSPVSRSGRQKRPTVWLILLLLILILGIAGTTYLYPSWPAHALAMFQSSATLTPTTETILPSETLQPTATTPAEPSQTATLEVVVATNTATSTVSPTATPAPTKTQTPNYTPTPVGGGGGQIAFASSRYFAEYFF